MVQSKKARWIVMAVSEAQRRANAKHDKENYEYCTVKVRKGKRAEVREHAQLRGESINGFINRAIDEAIARDNESDGAKQKK
jgi:predicted HicB family RNase H-like nuclease